MKIDKNYMEFIQSMKKQIVQSRYAAQTKSNSYCILIQGR